MRINLDIRLVPDLAQLLGRDKIVFEFEGETIGDMVNGLISKYGTKAREALYDSGGRFDGMIQIILNNEKWIRSDDLSIPLKDDDAVSLMLLIGGG